MKQDLLTSAESVIDALGGGPAVAALTGTTHQAVCNWRAFGKFPARTFLLFKHALEARELTAPPSLWRMAEMSATDAASTRPVKSRSRASRRATG